MSTHRAMREMHAKLCFIHDRDYSHALRETRAFYCLLRTEPTHGPSSNPSSMAWAKDEIDDVNGGLKTNSVVVIWTVGCALIDGVGNPVEEARTAKREVGRCSLGHLQAGVLDLPRLAIALLHLRKELVGSEARRSTDAQACVLKFLARQCGKGLADELAYILQSSGDEGGVSSTDDLGRPSLFVNAEEGCKVLTKVAVEDVQVWKTDL